jgi:predicted house-cleaning noncanonical NTP pyrophosphatase (MazG superfamily)
MGSASTTSLHGGSFRSYGASESNRTVCPCRATSHLPDKLTEEVEEFIASDYDPEELADILEVLYALAEHAGTSREQLERLRAAKAAERGLSPAGSSGAGTADSRSNLAVWPILPTTWS